MQVGGAEANEVVRSEEPSSAGHGVGPVSEAPTGAAGGTIPDFCRVVDVDAGVVVEDEDLVELFAPMKAPTVERTTTTATASAAICRRRRVL